MATGDATGQIPEQVLNDLSINGSDLALGQNNNGSRNGVPRTPFIMTTKLWRKTNNYLTWFCNPSDCSWKIPLRGAEQLTKTGRVTHNWFDPVRKTFYDEPEITFSFQSGNIFPVFAPPPNDAGTKPVISEGLNNFYVFIEMVQQARQLDDGSTNTVIIWYNSMIFPNLVLEGMFKPEGISFNDSAESPHQVTNWSATFTVYKTVPSFFSASELIDTFNRVGFIRSKS